MLIFNNSQYYTMRIIRGRGVVLVLLVICSAIVLSCASSSALTLNFDNVGSQAPDIPLSGTIEIVFNEFYPENTDISALLDGVEVSTLPISDYLEDTSSYSFSRYDFTYDIVRTGNNEWGSFPVEEFNYSINVTGLCGNPADCCNFTKVPPVCICDCNMTGGESYCNPSMNPAEFPCYWNITHNIATPFAKTSVDGTEKLKFIMDFAYLDIPDDVMDGSVVWKEFANDNPMVETTMRQKCRYQSYQGLNVDIDGWVKNYVLVSGLWTPSGSNAYADIVPFDHDSLIGEHRDDYTTMDIGGIYKDGVYQSYTTGSPALGANWNGTTGHIIVYNFNPTSVYSITFLTPNGPSLCAISSNHIGANEDWTIKNTNPYSGDCSYIDPYSRQFSENQLPQPPECPPLSGDCIKTTTSIIGTKTSETGGNIAVSYTNSTHTVSGAAQIGGLSQEYSFVINLADFAGLVVQDEGLHTLNITINNQISTYGWNSTMFGVCTDNDGDGYCNSTQGGNDCDDFDDEVNPNMPELCNMIDDNCDGKRDEGFVINGKAMGSPCGGAPNTACNGTWACTQNGTAAFCFRRFDVGELLEICDNDFDDDCDGEIDEVFLPNGGDACWCRLGTIRDCGSTMGICEPGSMTCEPTNTGYPAWSSCRNSVIPVTEGCNGLDDDCDGIIDNINGAASIQASACACYGGAISTVEICNDIDDNCNGVIDEGVSCCSDGQTRDCGTIEGVCTMGTQTCSGDSWGTACTGGTQPSGEICYNGQDDDCDGTVDEGCNLDYTCNNNIQDLNEDGVDCGLSCPKQCFNSGMWMIIAGIMILAILGVWFLVMRNRI